MGRELPSYLQWRGRTVYFRVRIPSDVATAYPGKTEICTSLRTGDIETAKTRGAAKNHEVRSEWQRVRASLAPKEPATPAVELTPARIQSATASLYLAELERDEHRREQLPSAADVQSERARTMGAEDGDLYETPALDLAIFKDQARADHDRRVRLLSELKRHLGDGETALIQWAADEAIRRDNLDAKRGSPAYRRLCRALMRAWIEALERTIERDAGDYAGQARDPVVAAPAAPSPVAALAAPVEEAETIMGLFDIYAKANQRGLKDDTLRVNRMVIEQFVGTLPAGAPVSAITKKAVREWQDLLRSLPTRSTDLNALKGRPMREVIEINKELGRPLITAKTINRYLSSLGSFCAWLESRDHIPANPVKGLYDRLDKSASPRRSYTDDELKAIFASPLFTGFKGDGYEHLPGKRQADDWRRWLPILALFTGARLAELAQLLVADIRQQDGHWLFHLTTHGDASKSLKNKGSARIVPVHAELARAGFLDFHARMQAAGHVRLFHDLEQDTRGHYGMPSRWFNRYFADIGVKVDKQVNFHSFRHTLIDAFRRAGYLDHEFMFMVGHGSENTKVTRGYGSLQEGTLDRRVDMISKIYFGCLNIHDIGG